MKATCSFPDCDRPAKTLGWCGSHYAQHWRGEKLRPLRSLVKGTIRERMDAYTDRTEECWIWTGSKVAGYGQLNVDGMPRRAHRLAYELEYGPIPHGVMLDHTCRNRACVRPQHLREVSNKMNMENLDPAGYSTGTSGVRGVNWDQQTSKWRAKVTHEGKTIHVGRFDTLEEAAAAVAKSRLELFTNSTSDTPHP